MLLTFTFDSLGEYQSRVSKREWEALLRNRAQLTRVKSEIEDVMVEVGTPCSILLTPHWETNSIELSYEWVGEGNVGDGIDRDEFFRFAVANSLLEYVGVVIA